MTWRTRSRVRVPVAATCHRRVKMSDTSKPSLTVKILFLNTNNLQENHENLQIKSVLIQMEQILSWTRDILGRLTKNHSRIRDQYELTTTLLQR